MGRGGAASPGVESAGHRALPLSLEVPKLRMIVMGLVGGLQSITYIMALLLLVFYMFGIAGMSLFSENDPFHFNTVPRAILSLFRAVTCPLPVLCLRCACPLPALCLSFAYHPACHASSRPWRRLHCFLAWARRHSRTGLTLCT